MKKWLGVLAGIGLMCVLVTTVEAATAIRWSETMMPEHPSAQMMKRVAEKVAQVTNGRIAIQTFPASQLGGSKETVEAVTMGIQEMVTEGAGTFDQWLPSLTVMEAPYVMRDADHLTKVMSGPIGQELAQRLVEKAGMRILGTTYYGVRQLTSTQKAVRTVADLKEFRLRVPDSDVFLAMARAWGAKPTPMTIGELYLALRQNVVDGQENPLPTIDAMKFYEVQKYVVLTAHVLTPRFVVINEKFWQSIPLADQRAISDALAEGISWQNAQIQASEKMLLEKFEKAGVQVIRPDSESFRKPVIENLPKQFEAKWGKGMYERIVDVR
jgi:tripartite ATP-independent transporter DctP family solute receptor